MFPWCMLNPLSLQAAKTPLCTCRSGFTASAICVYNATPHDGRENENEGIFDTFTEDVIAEGTGHGIENAFPFCDGAGRRASNSGGRVTAEDTVVTEPLYQLEEEPMIVMSGV